MSSVNKQIIIGRLGNDPEYKDFGNGSGVTNISVATSEKYTNKQGEKVEETEWFKVSMFGKLGEIAAKYLRKGSLVYIEGKTKTRKYTDSNGIDKYISEVIGQQMQMLSSINEGQATNNQQNNNRPTQNNQQGFNQRPRSETGLSPQQNQAPAMNGGGAVDDDIPFTKHFDGVM